MQQMGSMADEETALSMIDPGQTDLETLSTAMEDLRTQVPKVDDEEFQTQFEALDTAVTGFIDLYGQLDALYRKGDYAGAMTMYFASAHELILGHEENFYQ